MTDKFKGENLTHIQKLKKREEQIKDWNLALTLGNYQARSQRSHQAAGQASSPPPPPSP